MNKFAALALLALLGVTSTASANALTTDNDGARQAHEDKLRGDSYNFTERRMEKLVGQYKKSYVFNDGARLAHEEKLRGDSYAD